MKKYTKFIIEYDNFISNDEADQMLYICKNYLKPKNETLVKNRVRNNKGYNVGSFLNNNYVVELHKRCCFLGQEALSRYGDDCPLIRYNFDDGRVGTDFVYRTYDKNDYYDWHVDRASYNLKLSFLLYLNDDFEGGNTLFLNDKLKVSPKKGTLLMFPCGPYFIHKSSKIISGEKHVIWNCFLQTV